MPSNRNPNDVQLGLGRAGQGTVTASALVSNVSINTTISGSAIASQISVTPPLRIAGDNLQTHVDVISRLAPTILNVLGTATDSRNPGTITLTPGLVAGLQGAGADPVLVCPSTSTTLEAILFPADRGVLAVEIDSGAGFAAIQALNLSAIFTEGTPESTAVPARILGQNDYLAGSSPAGTVAALPQNISLKDRLPRRNEYARASFPFLAAGVDPVYDSYPEIFEGQQLARVTATINLGGPGLIGDVRIVHYKTLEDFGFGQAGAPFSAYAQIDLADVYVDTDATALNITDFEFLASNGVFSLDPSPRYLSGIHYYSPIDEFEFTWTATGMYSQTFLEQGVELQSGSGTDLQSVKYTYTVYSPGGTAAGTGSSYNVSVYMSTQHGTLILDPYLRISDPQGNTDVQLSTSTNKILWSSTLEAALPALETIEVFYNETARYGYLEALDPSQVFLTSGAGSTFDPLADISNLPELQVRGLTQGRGIATSTGGGELVFPSGDYSTGHNPTSRDGVLPQYDYSSPTLFGFRGYARAFNLTSSSLQGKIRIQGTPVGSDIWSDLQNPFVGCSVKIAPAGNPDAVYLDVARPLGQGALVNAVLESPTSVLITFCLNSYPILQSSEYPVIVLVEMSSFGTAATSGDFSLQLIQVSSL